MIYGIEGGSEIQQHQNIHKTGVYGSLDITANDCNGGHHEMASSVGGLSSGKKEQIRKWKTCLLPTVQPLNSVLDKTDVEDQSVTSDIDMAEWWFLNPRTDDGVFV